MAGDQFSVQFGPLNDSANQLLGHHQNLVTTFDELKAKVNSSLDTWDGAAKQVWLEVQADCDRRMAHMSDVLHLSANNLFTAGDTWQESDLSSAKLWTL